MERKQTIFTLDNRLQETKKWNRRRHFWCS